MVTKKKEIKEVEIVKPEGKFFYGRGGRKTSSANVRLYLKGKGEIIVNNLDYKVYFPTKDLQDVVLKPLVLTGHDKNTTVSIHVAGGGKNGQAAASRHGIARALEQLNPELRPAMKAEGLMTRDPRVKERKKPGLKRARRAPQWSKR
ncbi:MAG: 30S ribosomal protein S9 [Patescibacteria group bacterium]|jgi:small subunit ribosomal protein S9